MPLIDPYQFISNGLAFVLGYGFHIYMVRSKEVKTLGVSEAKLDWTIEPIEGGYVVTQPDMMVGYNKKGAKFVPAEPTVVSESKIGEVHEMISQWRKSNQDSLLSINQVTDTQGFQRFAKNRF